MTQKYEVQWSYKSGIGGPWGAGAVVNLDDDVAEAINKDSPDVLVLWAPEPEPETEPETETPKRAPKAPAKDRQMTGRATRRKPASKDPIADDN